MYCVQGKKREREGEREGERERQGERGGGEKEGEIIFLLICTCMHVI